MSATWSRSSRAPPGAGGVNPPPRSVIVGVGPPSTSADFRGGLCYLDAVEPEPTRSRPADWRALTLGVGTALVQRLVMEQPRPFDVDVAEAAFGYQ